MTRQRIVRRLIAAVLVAGLVSVTTAAFKDTGPLEEKSFTKTDASMRGGIKGSIVSPSKPMKVVIAMCYDDPSVVYKATLSGSSFSFQGLPPAVYDLIVIYDTECWEGMSLMRRDEKSTLTREDMFKINNTVEKSEKFYRVKIIHRLEGTTGRGNKARGVITMLKDIDAASFEYGKGKDQWKHCYKLYILTDVGPGWQVEKSRTIWNDFINRTKEEAYPEVKFSKELQRIRVSDYVNDIGEINLTKPN